MPSKARLPADRVEIISMPNIAVQTPPAIASSIKGLVDSVRLRVSFIARSFLVVETQSESRPIVDVFTSQSKYVRVILTGGFSFSTIAVDA
jgi:hypothetical protein